MHTGWGACPPCHLAASALLSGSMPEAYLCAIKSYNLYVRSERRTTGWGAVHPAVLGLELHTASPSHHVMTANK